MIEPANPEPTTTQSYRSSVTGTVNSQRYSITHAIIKCPGAVVTLAGVSRERIRRQPRSQTREKLLDAAARVFAERGFHGASVEAVSEEAGFSTGALYSNFAGKEELFLSLYEERVERRRRELQEVVRRSGDLASGLTSAAGTVDESLRRDRDFFLLYFEFALHAARNPQFARRLEAVRDEALAELASALSDGLVGAGATVQSGAEDLARAVRALSYGLALDRLIDEDDASGNLIERILRLLFAGLRAEGGS